MAFRLVFSLAGGGVLIAAYALNGINGIASLEIAIFGGGFFGLSALHAARGLLRLRARNARSGAERERARGAPDA